MIREPEEQPEEHLQHAAEHEQPAKHNPVVIYLLILFIAAFLLLLLSFLMQRRANREAIDDLEQTSNSAVESLANMVQENQDLKLQVADLEEANQQAAEEAAEAAEAAAEAQALLSDAQDTLQALSNLNTLRALYNQGRFSDARAFLAQLEEQTGASTEELLQQYTETYADEAQLEIYNPLEAWQQLVEWLQ